MKLVRNICERTAIGGKHTEDQVRCKFPFRFRKTSVIKFYIKKEKDSLYFEH